jgi:hypothetical protein
MSDVEKAVIEIRTIIDGSTSNRTSVNRFPSKGLCHLHQVTAN